MEAVAGKSKAEVIAIYGEPDSIARADTTKPGPNWSEEKIEEWNRTTACRALVYGDTFVELNKYDTVVGVHRAKSLP
jgi:hypothetical protein